MLHLDEILKVDDSFIHLEEFVGRVAETNQFQGQVDKRYEERDSHKRIIVFYGEPGIGKTMLLDRLEFECIRMKVPYSRINFESGTRNNAIEILRELVRELDSNGFESWTQKEQIWFSAGVNDLNINVAAQGGGYNISADNVTDVNFSAGGDMVAGNKVEVKNNTINVSASTRAALDPAGAQTSLTDEFVTALGEFVKQRPAAILFEGLDHEYCSPQTRAWAESLLDRIRVLKGYGVLPVVTYFNEPKYERKLDIVTFRAALKPLTEEHIVEYFRARRIPESIILAAAQDCIKNTDGIPVKVLAHVDNLISSLQNVKADLERAANTEVTLVQEILEPAQETSVSETVPETLEQSVESAISTEIPVAMAELLETVQESIPAIVMEEPQVIEQPLVEMSTVLVVVEPDAAEAGIRGVEVISPEVEEQGTTEETTSEAPVQLEVVLPEEKTSEESAPRVEAVESVGAEAQADSEVKPPVQEVPQVEIEQAESQVQIAEQETTPPPALEPVAESPAEANAEASPSASPAIEVPPTPVKVKKKKAPQPIQPVPDEAKLSAEALRRSQERLKELKSEGKSSTANMVELLLEQQSPEVAEIARRCAVLRWFNADLIEVLADQPMTSEQIAASIDIISSWRFVQNYGYGIYAYRKEVQQHLRTELQGANPELYADIHRRAYAYFDKKLGLSASIDEMIWVILPSEQITALREYLYYLLQVDVARGFNVLGQLFQSAQRLYLHGEAAILLKFAEEVDGSALGEQHKNRLTYYEAALEFAEGAAASAEGKLRELLVKPLEPELNAQVLGQLGVILAGGGKFDEAIKTFEQAQRLWQGLKRERERAKLSNNLGNVYMRKNDPGRAERAFTDALNGLNKVGTPSERALTLNNLGNVYMQKENLSTALDYYQKSLQTKTSIGDQYGAANTYSNLGTVYQRMAQEASGKKQMEFRQQAVNYYTRSLDSYRAFGARSNQGKLLFKLAYFYYQAGDKAKAREYLPDALDIFRDLEMPDLENASKLEKQLG